MSSVGLTEAEDWLDVGEVASLPFLSIDDVLNEVDHLDDSLSFLEDPEDNSVLGTSTSPSTCTSYHLDCAVRIKTLESITHQLLSLRGKGGTAHAVAESEGRIAIVTSRGMLLLFDRQVIHIIKLPNEMNEKVKFIHEKLLHHPLLFTFRADLNILYQVLSAHNGSVVSVLRECVQVGHGILQVLFLDNTRSLLALDSGGSVFEIRKQRSIAGKSNQHVRCVFSGCNGEVVHMRLLSHSLLAFLTVSKVLIVSVKFGGSVLCAFPLRNSAHWPPLIDVCEQVNYFPVSVKSLFFTIFLQNSSNDISICIGRGNRLSIFRLHTSCLSQKNRAASLLRIIILSTPIVNLHWITDNIIISLDRKGSCLIIDCNKGLVTRSTTPEVQLLFATSDYKGLATGGNVSAALRCLAECICYQSVCRQKRAVLVLAHDGLYEFGLLSGDEQFELFQSRNTSLFYCEFVLEREYFRPYMVIFGLSLISGTGLNYLFSTILLVFVPNIHTVQVYRCITSVKGKDGSASKENYPYLRFLLLFDAQQIGLLATELRKETVLVHFLLMVSQLVDNNHILAPVEIVDAVGIVRIKLHLLNLKFFIFQSVACLLRLTWQDPSAERSVVDILRSVPQLDRSAVLRMAQSPFRPRVCTLIYFDERRFIDLINCYILDNSSHEVFSAIRSIQQADLSPREFEDVTVFVRSIIPMVNSCAILQRLSQIDPVECAQILIDYFSDQLSVLRVESSNERSAYFPLINAAFQLRRDRLESFLSNDEDLDEYLFGIVFEGIVRRGGDGLSTSLKSILTYWLPLGSRTDFCLNIAAEAGCVEATIMLMESRQLINQAFELLFDQLQSNIGNDGMMVQWLDNMLSFCARHSSLAHGQGWLMQIFRCITQATVDNGSHGKYFIPCACFFMVVLIHTSYLDVDSRLQSLTARILESGSEHALELLQCLMEYPAFRDGLYRDYAPLINAILSACSFETSVIRDLLLCMEWEGASGLSSMSRQLCRRLEHTVDGKCINCGKGLQKSAYLFSCGHIMHMQCDDGNRSCSCLKGKPQNVQPSRKSFATEEIKWWRKTQAEKHETRDVFATWNKPLRLAPGTLDDGNTL
uniref:Vps8 domain-containing protein n=1 Tax=Heterorhabditis bacteriophora TaxID=37862 RepID=A0A1I7WMM9_HETBA